MKKMFRFSILEMMVVIAIILILISIVMPILQLVKEKAQKTKVTAAVKSIGLIMISYAEDDLRGNKMPYPIARGVTPVQTWGSTKECSSAGVVKMLFQQKYMRKGEESQIISTGRTGQNYVPMTIYSDVVADKDKFFLDGSELDYQLFCGATLTSNVSGKLILVATYDNDDIRECQFDNGSGWVIFFADKTTEFVKRANLKEYDIGISGGTKYSLKVEDPKSITAMTPPGIAFIATSGGSGGGSTELMGKRDTDAAYKALIR